MRDSAVPPESRAAGRSRPGASSHRQAGRSLPACREGLGLARSAPRGAARAGGAEPHRPVNTEPLAGACELLEENGLLKG